MLRTGRTDKVRWGKRRVPVPYAARGCNVDLLEAGLMPLLGRVVGALTDSRGVGDSSWRGSWVEIFR